MNNCKALIQDHYGNEYKCGGESSGIVTTITTKKNGEKVFSSRQLCDRHAKIVVKRYRYDIKHKGKKCEISYNKFSQSISLICTISTLTMTVNKEYSGLPRIKTDNCWKKSPVDTCTAYLVKDDRGRLNYISKTRFNVKNLDNTRSN